MSVKESVDVVDTLLPPETSPLTKWRIMMAGCVMLGIIHVLWACGWMSFLGAGFAGFAQADTLEKTVAPITQQLNAITSQLKQQLANSKASEIRVLAAKRCLVKGVLEKEAFNAELEIKGREYFEIQGYTYTIPSCDDLK
jgi:hypothetical protein